MNNDEKKIYFDSFKKNEFIASCQKQPDIKKLSKKESIFNFLFLIWSFLFIDFAAFHGFNAGFTISFYALFALATAYLSDKSIKASVFSYLCGALSLAGALVFALYSDLYINIIMIFLVFALFTVYICGISGTFRSNQGSFKMLFDMLSGVFIAPLINFSTLM
ncbi:MAG: hypothetical protein LUG21_03900, partial [Clostridiales bacterium]|nr:hypothetical protein [Clostridiales bacterium]